MYIVCQDYISNWSLTIMDLVRWLWLKCSRRSLLAMASSSTTWHLAVSMTSGSFLAWEIFQPFWTSSSMRYQWSLSRAL